MISLPFHSCIATISGGAIPGQTDAAQKPPPIGSGSATRSPSLARTADETVRDRPLPGSSAGNGRRGRAFHHDFPSVYGRPEGSGRNEEGRLIPFWTVARRTIRAPIVNALGCQSSRFGLARCTGIHGEAYQMIRCADHRSCAILRASLRAARLVSIVMAVIFSVLLLSYISQQARTMLVAVSDQPCAPERQVADDPPFPNEFIELRCGL